MTCLLLTLAVFAPRSTVTRDAYGVPRIQAATVREAWASQGFAAAEDRIWQMETSRHLARGTLASILGRSALNSDIEVAKSGYTSEELQRQVDRLTPFAKNALEAYTEGVNRFLSTRSLPPEFRQNEDKPDPWTALDSVAICVRLFQEFGKGGAGELRNLAFLQYAKSQPRLKDHLLDALDDFAWQNDSAAVTTVSPQDDPQSNKPPVIFPPFDRAITEARLKELPLPGLFELLPAARLAERDTSHRLAESLSLPFRTGSYCVVVSPSRSATGNALLLSGPQMGFTTPSVLHEVSVNAPGLHITGADVPGVPGVVVGETQSFAWGVTSGVADTEDIVWSHTVSKGYLHDGRPTAFIVRHTNIAVKGDSPQSVTRKWTASGPVVLESPGNHLVFSRHSAYRGVELQSFDSLLATYRQSRGDGIDRAISSATMNFNYFYATTAGDIGYRYVGRIPVRAPGLDPRLPTPDEAQFQWQGFLRTSRMPHLMNPASGILANWNNKPTTWWPNGDTPTWGRIHEANILFSELKPARFSINSLSTIVEAIAKRDETWPFFQEQSPPFDGLLLDGSGAASNYVRWFEALRDNLIKPTTEGFLDPAAFRIVAQPTLVWNALHGRTKLDFLRGRSPASIVPMEPNPPITLPYFPSTRTFDSLGTMRYANRGTYIQLVELTKSGPQGQSCLPPGETTADPHAGDQLELANHWTYKPMHG